MAQQPVSVPGVHTLEHFGMPENRNKTEDGQHGEPGHHYGAKGPSNDRGSHTLDKEQHGDNNENDRYGMDTRVDDPQSFNSSGNGDRRGNDTVGQESATTNDGRKDQVWLSP